MTNIDYKKYLLLKDRCLWDLIHKMHGENRITKGFWNKILLQNLDKFDGIGKSKYILKAKKCDQSNSLLEIYLEKII